MRDILRGLLLALLTSRTFLWCWDRLGGPNRRTAAVLAALVEEAGEQFQRAALGKTVGPVE